MNPVQQSCLQFFRNNVGKGKLNQSELMSDNMWATKSQKQPYGVHSTALHSLCGLCRTNCVSWAESLLEREAV